jgi:hypothetical protein
MLEDPFMNNPSPKPEKPQMPHAASWAIAGFVIAVFITLVLAFVNLQEKTIGYWVKPNLAQPPQLLPKATPVPAAIPGEPKPVVDVVKTAPETLLWQSTAEGLAESQVGGKALLYFFTDGSSDLCQKVESDFFADGQIAARINRSFIPMRVTDGIKTKGQNSAEVMNLENKYQVSSFPVIVVQAPGRKTFKKMVSYSDAPSAMTFLNNSVK